MTEPTVCCVMLTKDRAAMAARAVRSFRAQTYSNKELLIFDSGDPSWYGQAFEHRDEYHLGADAHDGKTIGALRNIANSCMSSDIIAHFDSDDYSHPSRIQEQVALLQASGADCVGYNECLFWDTRGNGTNMVNCRETTQQGLKSFDATGEAWLYRCPSPTYGLGSSLCYWRRSWEQKPFADINHGEDVRFITGLKVVGITSLCHPAAISIGPGSVHYFDKEPRMICSIHGRNSSVYAPEKDRNMWKRAADWDTYCERTMRL